MMENYDGTLRETISFEGKIIVVETEKACAEATAYLSQQKIVGFDTETRPAFSRIESRGRKVALLQLSDDKRAYLFRLNKIGLPDNVCAVLSNPNVTKIGAAIHDDIRTLNKLSPFTPESFIDIQRIAEEYGIQHKALKTLAEIVLNGTISKGQQLSNWERLILSDAQQQYAATDAWVCREIYIKLQTMEKKKRSNDLTTQQINNN